MSLEELLDEASLNGQEAANSCPCGERQKMMGVFDVIEGGFVVDAAAALGSCKCDEAREFLRGPPSGGPTGEVAGRGGAIVPPVGGGLKVCRARAVGRSFGGVRWHRWFGG